VDFEPIRKALVEAIEDLPDRQQDALRLRILDGNSYADVARALSCTEINARQRVSRGLRTLALALQERGLALTTEAE
jgi:RNA polymerase sigma-70 factor (ECF subfamily)